MPIKKIAFFAILFISFFIINNLIQSISGLWQKDQLVLSAKRELEAEKQKNQELKKQLAVVEKPKFLEEEARNKLFLVKPGESVIIIPTNFSNKQHRGEADNKLASQRSGQQTVQKPNWQQWWELFTKTQ